MIKIYTQETNPDGYIKKLAFSINGELRFDQVNNFVDNYKIDNNPHSKSFSLILSVSNSSFRTYVG
ncbi:MAG: hypothetical protein QME25_07215 [Bacteroidota bacterium]|nr:hypothetical protein [Bacteroidota bacterium]